MFKNRKIVLQVGLVLSVILIQGCSFSNPSKLDPLANHHYLYESGERGVIIVTNDAKNKVAFCAEPFLDVAITTDVKSLIEVKGNTKINASAKLDILREVLALEGRSKSSVILSQALYRLCELTASGNFAQAKGSFDGVINSISKVAEAEIQKAKASIISSQTKTINKVLDTNNTETINKVFGLGVLGIKETIDNLPQNKTVIKK